MSQAVRLAKRGLYTCMPNPRVGCVLTKNNQVIGQGWHHQTGKNHAEINALQQAGGQARGACAYVTLEPCSHYGRTPPCAKALIRAGIAKVVVAMEDPNPEVSGKGTALLRQAGITVVSGLLQAEAEQLNPGYIRRMKTGIPFVRCKMAMSFDGRTAMASGESKWITGAEAREDVQRLRGRSCAIITGIESVLADDPAMNFRAEASGLTIDSALSARQPLRIIVDSSLRTPVTARLFSVPGPVIVICGHVNKVQQQKFYADVMSRRKKKLHESESHLEVIELPGASGQIDLPGLFRLLGERQCNEILIEAGATLAGYAIKHALTDELWIYMAAVLMGSAAKPLFNLPLEKMSDKLLLKFNDVRPIGQDWRFIATIKRSLKPEG
ncbi:MAG: bifunctional diaminohydroxyphosphoribosylaminopyrimidine deaminase/5-amino-6-(5-phosphoribosylamino)uracil reductase RibD [Endozoicomonadaceae bacterium]|nr:bifunctional diaminohydroxyphosphoribosylaminopyrimidine deaminase/5-amino-6-(5-phosphoribosylamino)uracil reductase RibD [Endozoicomonadaceae bacterium]